MLNLTILIWYGYIHYWKCYSVNRSVDSMRGWFSRGWCGSYVNQLGQRCYSLAQEGSMSLGKAVCLQSLNPLKTSSCIYRPILHFSVYCSRAFRWEMWDFSPFWKHLRLTNKQTDKLKDNKACGQTSWWSDGEPGVIIWSQRCLSLSRTPVHVGQIDSLLKGSVFAASVFKQWMHSSCNL